MQSTDAEQARLAATLVTDMAGALLNYERAFAARDQMLPWIFAWPLTDELRGEPVFEAMRGKLGLPVCGWSGSGCPHGPKTIRES